MSSNKVNLKQDLAEVYDFLLALQGAQVAIPSKLFPRWRDILAKAHAFWKGTNVNPIKQRTQTSVSLPPGARCPSVETRPEGGGWVLVGTGSRQQLNGACEMYWNWERVIVQDAEGGEQEMLTQA